jgi:multidrug efflux pump subunit AcrA (membrane-fusion protein)
VVAPCEVVANDPIVVTAPLEGIIEKIDVKPGQMVTKGALLYEYDKRLPLRNLSAAQKSVEILEEEVKRAKTLGLNDAKSLTELSILNLKLQNRPNWTKKRLWVASS